MIYLIGLISGIINGLFASGAGQILVFYLVFVLKIDTYLGRSVSISLICIASIFTFFNYYNNISIDITKVFIVIFISAIFGYIGSSNYEKNRF
jgi:uncharacterized protein